MFRDMQRGFQENYFGFEEKYVPITHDLPETEIEKEYNKRKAATEDQKEKEREEYFDWVKMRSRCTPEQALAMVNADFQKEREKERQAVREKNIPRRNALREDVE